MCDEKESLLPDNDEDTDKVEREVTSCSSNRLVRMDDSNHLSKIQQFREKCIETIKSRFFWKALLLGQFISILLCGTGVTSGLLADMGVHIPTAQSFVNYVLLCLTFTMVLACRTSDRNLKSCLKTWWWKYLLLAIVDVEANYLIVKAYSFTTVTSVQLLDCFSIPAVMVLSYKFLQVRFKFVHIFGVVVCVLGLGGLVLTDVLTDNGVKSTASNTALGDILVICAAVLYGIDNVAEEYVVKRFDRVEFLGMLGLFGSIINGIQFTVLERHEVVNLGLTSYKIVLLLIGFAVCQFLQYVLIAVIVEHTSATVFNLSILSADFYALLIGIFLFKYEFHVLYFVSFVLILSGIGIYTSKKTRVSESQSHIMSNTTMNVQEEDSASKDSGNNIATDSNNLH